MSKIKIILKGLAFCYYKNDGADGQAKWRVIFPIDQREHRLFFSANGGAYEELAVPRRIIRLETANGKRPDKPKDEDFERLTLNMTDSSIHPQLRLRNNWQQKSVIMYLESAKFHVHKRADREFYLVYRQFPSPAH